MAYYVPSTVLENVKNHFSSGETAGVVSVIFNNSLFWGHKKGKKAQIPKTSLISSWNRPVWA